MTIITIRLLIEDLRVVLTVPEFLHHLALGGVRESDFPEDIRWHVDHHPDALLDLNNLWVAKSSLHAAGDGWDGAMGRRGAGTIG